MQALAPFRVPINWGETLEDLPEGPWLAISNEFLDALPFRQWIKASNTWVERGIGAKEGELVYTIRPNQCPLETLPADHANQVDGTIFETAPAREAIVADCSERLKAQSGAALFIDYGHLASGYGDTFQAIRNHEYVSPLAEPGQADLTSHVDFARLRSIADKAGCHSQSTTQAEFLLGLGLLERAGHLGRGKTAAIQSGLQRDVERLAGPDQMGELFEVLELG